MCKCEFKFPLLNGGQEVGIKDAGIETFNSDSLMALARECAQNSLDAKAKEETPVNLSFKFHRIPLNEIPGVTDLRNAFKQCKSFWSGDSSEYEFSDKALSYFMNPDISVLEISDYNTTGLCGGDKERGKPWHALVMSTGVCNKNDNDGGGFGIGKNAPFVVSAWRTVFYSSLTSSGEYAFRGVCHNLTHYESENNKKETQGIGYYGYTKEDDSNIYSIREEKEIPLFFRRTKPGTSIFILAFEDIENSIDKLKHAVLDNFWPAIYFDKINFDINGEKVNQTNLAECMAHDEELKLFMQCLESPDKIYAREAVGLLKECELFVWLTNQKCQEIVCTRSSRMKIQSYKKQWKLEGICFIGLFSCLSPEGNCILKNMEPPAHNEWDSKRRNNKGNSLSEYKQKKILTEMRNWIRGKIDEKVKKNYAEETDLEDIAQYFDAPSDRNGTDSEEENNHDGFSSTVKKIKVTKILTGKVSRSVDIPIAASDERGEGGVIASRPNGEHGGGGKGAVRGGEEDGSPGHKQAGNVKKRRFPARSFIANDEYVLFIKSQDDFNGALQLQASGEEESEKLEITEARTDKQNLPVVDGKISKISIKHGEKYKLYIKTKNKEHFSVEVIGYESH